MITSGKKLTVRKIIRFAIQHIPDNYPHHPYSYLAYYRDYQREQSQYVNLNEAIIEVFDQGFGTDDLQSTREKLYRYRENVSFPRDSTTVASYELDKNKFIPGVRLFPFGGNELSILRIHDALRNNQRTTYSFVNVFNKDFINNHSFKLLGTVYLNHIALYKINIQSLSTVSRQNYTSRGEIYIEHGNYAIHKLSYATYERTPKEEKLLYNIELEYARSDSQFYLNYISCNNFFLSKSNEGLVVTKIVLDKQNKIFEIHFNHPPATKSALHAGNYQIKFKDHNLDIDKIKIAPSDDKEVILGISSEQASMITDLTKIQVGFKGIKDKMGRAVDEIVYKEVNQFREMFLQKLNPTNREPDAGPFIAANRALKQNEIDSTKNSSSYWMNTPLKEMKCRSVFSTDQVIYLLLLLLPPPTKPSLLLRGIGGKGNAFFECKLSRHFAFRNFYIFLSCFDVRAKPAIKDLYVRIFRK